MQSRINVIIIYILIILLVFQPLFYQHLINVTPVSSYQLSKRPTIIIDPGHGGEDGGAVSVTGSLEKDINLSISKKLNTFLTANGYNTALTRTNDSSLLDHSNQYNKHLDLEKRVDMFNSSHNNIVVSIHQNKFTQEQYSGAQVFYSQNNSNSKFLAENIKNSVKYLIQNDNNRECKKAGTEIFVLNKSTVPTVLVECGFLSNSIEAKLLENDEYQNKLAYSIYLGILEFENTIIRNDNNGKN